MTSSKHGTGKYEKLLRRCKSLQPVPTAVAHPCEKTALLGAVEAGEKGLIEMLKKRGPLRAGLSVADAVDTFATIVHPDTYAFLTRRRGWTPARYERWVAQSLQLLLLP